VLSLETGYSRNYGSGVTYQAYFASPDLMFPAVVSDETQIKRKDYVFGIRDIGSAKAWPIKVFRTKPVINDRVGFKDVVRSRVAGHVAYWFAWDNYLGVESALYEE